MKVYIDLFFIFNFILDTIILMATSAILKRKTNIIKILLGGFIGSISTLLLFTNINILIIELVSVVIMSIISFNYKNIKYTIKNIFYIYIISSLLGGILYLFNIRINNTFIYYLVITIISIEIILLYIKEMKKLKNNYNNYYKVVIYFDDNNILSLIGFVDTGNNLYDPYKHRPIILVDIKYQVDKKYILVPYYTASSSGLLKCIKAKYISIDSNIIPNVLVAFSNNIKLEDGVEVILHKDLMKGE